MNLGRLDTRITAFTLALLSCAVAGIAGCKPTELVGGCGIADDQRGSFMAKIGIEATVTVVADSSFLPSERNAISTAVTRWNEVGQKVAGRRFFQFATSSIPHGIRKMDPDDCRQEIGTEDRFYIVKETDGKDWSQLGFNDNIPGATIRCSGNGPVEQQIIFINTALADQAQLATIMIHELGHALGLDHSCMDGEGKPDFVACAKVKSSTHPYRVAAMYPTILRGSSPEVKEAPRDNDITRTRCLYGKTP